MQTPHRFRTKRQLWAYSGLALETHSSAEYHYVQGQLQRSKRPVALRGLNQNHNHDLKSIFKGAATKAGTAKGPFHDFYTCASPIIDPTVNQQLGTRCNIVTIEASLAGWSFGEAQVSRTGVSRTVDVTAARRE
jgi:hypothetical protein